MEVLTLTVEYAESDYGRREQLLVNGKEVMYVGPMWDCPEDATLERDLKGPSDFVYLFEKIISEHNGKKVKVEFKQVEEL